MLYKPNGGGCTALAPASAVNVQTNQWYHVAATIDGATAKIYVDGVLQATVATAANFVPTNKFRIGGAACCAGDNTSGRIDEFSIYSRALTAKEIQSIYNAGLAGKLKQATTLTNTAMVGDATVTFSSTANRTVQEIPLDKNLFPALPMGTNTGLIYDVSADVNDASPTVCFNLPIISPAQFSSLRVFHLENNQWQNRTAPSNTYPMLCTTGLSSLSPFAIGLNSPTAATVSIGGQVLTAKGSGIANARLSLTDSKGETRSALTNGFGFYHFEEVAVGETYTLNVSAKRYQFDQSTQVISVYEELLDNNFTAMP